MFISGLGLLSGRQSGSLTERPSPSSCKCQFSGQERPNKEQLHKNTVVWRRDGCTFGVVGREGRGSML